jgi:hypothetical protein
MFLFKRIVWTCQNGVTQKLKESLVSNLTQCQSYDVMKAVDLFNFLLAGRRYAARAGGLR